MLSRTRLPISKLFQVSRNGYTTSSMDFDYAFEMANSNIRYGVGVTKEIGPEMKSLKAENVLVVTDSNIGKLNIAKNVIQSLEDAKVKFTVYDKVRIEPTDESFLDCINFAKKHNFDAFVAVGGGSVIDTCKAANLYSCYPEADLLEFVNAPIGKARPIEKKLKPLIAIPTTAGTGSETTGVAIFDLVSMKAKTGIASRALKPTLGMIDPENNFTTPSAVKASCGLDVLCHALESYTAIPYNKRTPRPPSPIYRPAYQGSNPISDIWSLTAFKMSIDYLPRSYKNMDDKEAHSQMLLASTYAGIGFGNAGVHICHGLSYPISGLNTNYIHPGYDSKHKIIPHGISVVVTAPSVFKFTSKADPDRHILAAQMLGANTTNTKREDAGLVLADALRKFLHKLDVPDGIKAFGFDEKDIPTLVKGALPQQRVLKISPIPVGEKELTEILQDSRDRKSVV